MSVEFQQNVIESGQWLIKAFLPLDAMPARHMLSFCVRLSVRLSVRHKSEFYKNG